MTFSSNEVTWWHQEGLFLAPNKPRPGLKKMEKNDVSLCRNIATMPSSLLRFRMWRWNWETETLETKMKIDTFTKNYNNIRGRLHSSSLFLHFYTTSTPLHISTYIFNQSSLLYIEPSSHKFRKVEKRNETWSKVRLLVVACQGWKWTFFLGFSGHG